MIFWTACSFCTCPTFISLSPFFLHPKGPDHFRELINLTWKPNLCASSLFDLSWPWNLFSYPEIQNALQMFSMVRKMGYHGDCLCRILPKGLPVIYGRLWIRLNLLPAKLSISFPCAVLLMSFRSMVISNHIRDSVLFILHRLI